MSTIRNQNSLSPKLEDRVCLPFALPIVQGKKLKKKCCKKYKKGKRCGRCPNV